MDRADIKGGAPEVEYVRIALDAVNCEPCVYQRGSTRFARTPGCNRMQ